MPAIPNRKRTLLAVLGGAFALVATAGVALPPGTTVLARTGADALVIWDASSDLAALISNKSSDDAMMHRLEADAAVILGDRARSSIPGAKTLTVQVIYQRTGAVSPVYQTATFQGIEHLVSIKAAVAAAATQSDGWADQLREGKIPSDLTVTVSGKLPQ